MSIIAEQNIIGALLLDKNNMNEIYNVLSADMFTSELLGRMYLEFQRGYDRRYDVSPAVMVQKMASEDYPESAVLEEIRQCMDNTLTGATVKSNARVIANDYKAKRLNGVLDAIKVSADGIDNQIGGIINDLEALMDNKKSNSKSLAEITKENKDKYFIDDEKARMYLGFPKLDDLLGGLEGGDMIVIGARPGVGKSAFVTQITYQLSEHGKKIGFYNLEMQEKQVYERFAAAQSGIGLTRLRRAKKFLGDEQEKFKKANDTLENKHNIIISTGSKTVSEIRHESRHMGYDIIIIDYLQLLKADTTYRGNRTAEVGAISKAIKALAMELNIPIIALSQLNRGSELRETKEPTMSELRETGDIEQDASVIILMWNLSNDNHEKKGCKVEKQRQGQLGKIVMNFKGDLMRFEETEESVSEAQQWSRKADDDCPFA